MPHYWYIPYQRNPYFTGREQLLKKLAKALRERRRTALSQPHAISGLGGIGKTQITWEYAYRYQHDYQAVFWVQADTREAIISNFVTIAEQLDLPEKEEQEQYRIIEAVKRWFRVHTGWLLIFDNANDLIMVRDFLPTSGKGHNLLTTRAYATGRIAQRIEIEEMNLEEGALFLLRRTKILDPDDQLVAASSTDQNTAKEIVRTMDGLPLALDQAGAYIEETGCGLLGYLQLYRKQGVRLLKERGELVTDHPEPVATTWSLSFEKVEQAYAAAAELLRFCAFLFPDAIPEELFTENTADLGPTLEQVKSDLSQFNAAIREVLKYSLIQRDPESKTLSIHRLVQEVLKGQMNEETKHLWAERAVRAVSRAFPKPEYQNWDRCRKLLLHAQACSALIEQWKLFFTEAATLLNYLGYYLWQRGEYEQVESLHQRALAIREKVLGPEDYDTADSLAHLAFFYKNQGKDEEAVRMYQLALAIYERVQRADHLDTAQSLNNLAGLYYNQRKYEEAEPLLQRALAIRERVLGPNHPNTVTTRENYDSLKEIMNKENT